MWCTAEKRFVPHVRLRNPFPLGFSWELQHALPALHYGCIMLAKDRVEVSKIWITGHRLWSRLSYIPDCWKSMKNCRDSAFSLRGLEAGLWAFRVQMLATCDDMLFLESIPAIPFWNSKPPLPTRSLRFLRAAVPSSNSALWLHHAHPFVAAAEKTCLMQRSRGFGHGVVVSQICYNGVFVLSVVVWDCCKPANTCRDWAFSNSGLEVGLPAFQLPMFAKCDALPKRDLFHMFVQGIHSHYSLCEFQASNPYQKLEFLPESHSMLHRLCVMAALCPSLCCNCRKSQSHAEKQRVWSRSCGLQDLLQCSDCALSCGMRLLQTNEHLSRLSF